MSQMDKIESLSRRFSELLVHKKVLVDRLREINSSVGEKEERLKHLLQSRAIIQEVAEETQSNVEVHISEIVSLALSAVFADPYEFKLSFVQRRGRTECDLRLIKDDNEFDPLTASGGGVVDVVSFALRLALWSLKDRRDLLILDEPFRFVSVDLQEKCSAMLKELSSRLGVQIIMVSHLPNIITSADTVFVVENVRGVSEVLEQTSTGSDGQALDQADGGRGGGRPIHRTSDRDSKTVLKRKGG